VPNSVLVRVVFGALVIATLGAFFVTQRLKRATPIVERVFYEPYISPTCKCKKDRVKLRFSLPKRDRVTVSMVNAGGDDVRTLIDDRRLGRGTHAIYWDGREDTGAVAPDGPYHLRVTLRTQGRSLTSPRTLTVDTKPPRPRILVVTPPTLLPGARGTSGRARIRYSGPSDPNPLVRVYRTDLPKPKEVTTFLAPRFRQTAKWDGLVSGRPALDGVYAITITTYDKAGNAGSAPSSLPPARGETNAGSGVSVRYLTLSAPLEPVDAGSVVRFRAGPIARRLRWNLSRSGPGAAVARGQARGGAIGLRVPSDARTGLYLLRVQAGGHRAVAPLAVRGRGRGPVLVVLPAIAWQGHNLVDDDNDGFPDTLAGGQSVQSGRPFAHGLPPAGLLSNVMPLLRFLDRERLPYDLTTDLALARGHGPRLGGRSGVLFASDETWLTDKLDVALRDYVDAGGRIASFGTNSFRRRVSVGPTALSAPTLPERVNVFGEQTAPARIVPAPMVVNEDRLGLFAHTDNFVGLFSRFEQSQGLVPGARVLTSAGRDAQHPAFVAYRLGKGLMIRTGTPDWASSIAGDIELTQVTRRIWTLLSR
jgi:hypothetical protein